MEGTKIYMLCTPSDPITFRAVSHAVAFTCALNLGRGKAACECEDGTNVPSMMLFADAAYLDATVLAQTGETNLQHFIAKNRQAVVECFRSFAYGHLPDRRDYDAAIEAITDPEKLKGFKAYHENQRRTSMSQWVAAAWELADFHEKEGKKTTATA